MVARLPARRRLGERGGEPDDRDAAGLRRQPLDEHAHHEGLPVEGGGWRRGRGCRARSPRAGRPGRWSAARAAGRGDADVLAGAEAAARRRTWRPSCGPPRLASPAAVARTRASAASGPTSAATSRPPEPPGAARSSRRPPGVAEQLVGHAAQGHGNCGGGIVAREGGGVGPNCAVEARHWSRIAVVGAGPTSDGPRSGQLSPISVLPTGRGQVPTPVGACPASSSRCPLRRPPPAAPVSQLPPSGARWIDLGHEAIAARVTVRSLDAERRGRSSRVTPRSVMPPTGSSRGGRQAPPKLAR